jgi:hypothetical protein
MFQQLLIIFAIVILVLLPTTTYSAGSFYCQSGSSQSCCVQLAHRVSNDYNSRCASIILTNNSGYSMTLEVGNLEDGRWLTSEDYSGENGININCEPHSLGDDESETISSVTSHFLGGSKGYVIFNIHDNTTSSFTISWNAPFIGSSEYNFNFYNESSYNDYDVTNSSEFENTVYKIKITNKHEKMPSQYIILIVSGVLAIIIILSSIFYYCCCRSPRPRLQRQQRFIPRTRQHVRVGPPETMGEPIVRVGPPAPEVR